MPYYSSRSFTTEISANKSKSPVRSVNTFAPSSLLSRRSRAFVQSDSLKLPACALCRPLIPKRGEKKEKQQKKQVGGCCRAQTLTNTMPWRCIQHKGFVLWMLHGCKVAKPSPALLARTQPHISKSLFSDTPWRETTPILLQFDKYCCISVHMIRGPPWRGMHGDYHRWGGANRLEKHSQFI